MSTGLPGFDRVIKGLIPGDNLVWQVSAVEDYAPFVEPYCAHARAAGQQLVYFRFARHDPLVPEESGARIYRLKAEEGFEAFITEIHRAIQQTGRGGYYVFDCLSDLAVNWFSDQMLDNFFRLTCPYLYDMEAIAYFAPLRNYHSSHATSAIAGTTQVLLDVYRHNNRLYVHPQKVQQRHSPTMYMLHKWEGDGYKINLVQCRPLPVKLGISTAIEPPANLSADDTVLEAHGAVIGQSRIDRLDRLIYVVPRVYGQLPIASRYAVARLIGRIVHMDEDNRPQSTMLLGPGRWGTTTPSLGVPVSFAEINAVSAVCEIVAMSEDVVPDVSLGTHFLNELIETDILYLALFPNQEGNRLNEELLEGAPSRLTSLVPDASEWADAVRVIDAADLPEASAIVLNANTSTQQVVCYLEREGG